MEKYSTRNDIPNEYKWDLSYLFKDEDSFNKRRNIAHGRHDHC